MKRLDAILAWTILALGVVHICVTPFVYPRFSQGAVWFAGAGLAGTLELSGVSHNIRRPRLEQLTKAAARYLKTTEDPTIKSEWCGLRPCLPDGLPALGAVLLYPGLLVATGHAMLGPVPGKLISVPVTKSKGHYVQVTQVVGSGAGDVVFRLWQAVDG